MIHIQMFQGYYKPPSAVHQKEDGGPPDPLVIIHTISEPSLYKPNHIHSEIHRQAQMHIHACTSVITLILNKNHIFE